MVAQPSFADNMAFQLVKLGTEAHRRYAARLETIGLRPRHVGLLHALAEGPLSQQSLAALVHVAPSVIVDMLDELEAVDAVERVRSQEDRRRQVVSLTSRGRRLAARALREAGRVDDDMLRSMSSAQRDAVHAAVLGLADAVGVAGPSPTASGTPPDGGALR